MEGTASQCITVDLLEMMRTQSGPYRASETIDMTDILHIGGVLYAGKLTDSRTSCSLADPRNSCDRYREDGSCCITLLLINHFCRPPAFWKRSSLLFYSIRKFSPRYRRKSTKRQEKTDWSILTIGTHSPTSSALLRRFFGEC